MNNRFRFDAPSVADEEELDDQLVAYNLRKVPCRQGEPFVKFCRCAYNEKNELVGGVLACSILWNILSIESVWVAENYRGQGIAARLLKEVEEEAKAAGCYMAQIRLIFRHQAFMKSRAMKYSVRLPMHQRDIHIIT